MRRSDSSIKLAVITRGQADYLHYASAADRWLSITRARQRRLLTLTKPLVAAAVADNRSTVISTRYQAQHDRRLAVGWGRRGRSIFVFNVGVWRDDDGNRAW